MQVLIQGVYTDSYVLVFLRVLVKRHFLLFLAGRIEQRAIRKVRNAIVIVELRLRTLVGRTVLHALVD